MSDTPVTTSSRRRTRVRWAGDTLLAVALTAVSVVAGAAASAWTSPPRQLDGLGYTLTVLACGVVTFRRSRPTTTLAVATVAVTVYLALGYPYDPVMFAIAIAVYTVARSTPTVRTLWTSAIAYAVLASHVLVDPAALSGFVGLLPAAAWIAIPAAIGWSRRTVDEARARERAETERRLRDEERLRVAHEVHDVVGHGLAAIQMQADIALHLVERKPDQGVRALEAIRSASAAALTELRDTLRSITPGDDLPSRARVAGLARLDELCDRTRTAGVDVRLSVTGTAPRLPPAVDLAAYRIIQESLTNVVKHAMQRRATVDVTYGVDTVAITVTSPHDGSIVQEGFGIRGIRRHATSIGGTLDIRTGPTLRLHVVLPAAPLRPTASP